MTYIFAHRGAAGTHPENTMAAFEEALKAGADGIELDVQLTKDGEPVVIHDETVDRTTDGSGWVKDILYRELRKFNAAAKWDGRYGHCPIPHLEEVLAWLAPTRLLVNIELKNSLVAYERLEQKVIAVVRRYGLENRTIFSSFNHNSMRLCRQLAPEIETALLYMEPLYDQWTYVQAMNAGGVHPYHRTVTADFAADARRRGVAVRPFTVNKPKTAKTMFAYKVDAIFTDYPRQAKEWKEKTP
ncbi:Glycerophosphoryl diester phosphodiesterase [[Flavobacterium] thermophilum]|nr:Glycerophosphoryl diester phosphodiesterase [[Flavobacterium] thermophilum]